MEIVIKSLIEGARQADGLVVIVDVFRAFTTASVAFSRNAKKIYFKVFYNDLSEWRFIVDTIKNLNEVGEVKILSLSLNEASLEVYISYRKKSDLHRLLRNYRIDIQSNSENENLYDVKIINAQDDNDKIINEDKTQSGENSDILVIE